MNQLYLGILLIALGLYLSWRWREPYPGARATAKALRAYMANNWGRLQLSEQRYLRAMGQEPSVIDLRYISQKEWQPFTNVVPLGG